MILGWLKCELPRINFPLLFLSSLEKFLNQTNKACGTTPSPPIFFKRVELIIGVWMQKEKELSNFDIKHMFCNTGIKNLADLNLHLSNTGRENSSKEKPKQVKLLTYKQLTRNVSGFLRSCTREISRECEKSPHERWNFFGNMRIGCMREM